MFVCLFTPGDVMCLFWRGTAGRDGTGAFSGLFSAGFCRCFIFVLFDFRVVGVVVGVRVWVCRMCWMDAFFCCEIVVFNNCIFVYRNRLHIIFFFILEKSKMFYRCVGFSGSVMKCTFLFVHYLWLLKKFINIQNVNCV